MTIFASIVVLWALLRAVHSDFVYGDFNVTTGLIFNGAAGTTACWDDPAQSYGDVQGRADLFNSDVIKQREETTDAAVESTTETHLQIYNTEIEKSQAGFLHRKGTLSAPSRCKVRARLTPSNPAKVGSIWFRNKVAVSNGFETSFTFQITDHSKECTLHRDQYFTQVNHRTCSVHGGDGFAFVVQYAAENATDIIGSDGGQMGFGGIPNSIAIAFDTWQNPGEDKIFTDHISVQSRGVLPNDALEIGLLGQPRSTEIADGAIHLARIVYYNDLRAEYFNELVASATLTPYLMDNGEQKRIGTLVVFIDDGIAEDKPLLTLPINLSLLLKLADDKAYVGFTSSTGRFFEKHDILSWHWCDQYPCLEKDKSTFDYSQESKYYPNANFRRFEPGAGYGGGDNIVFPTKNRSPDTEAWSVPVEHFSSSRTNDVSADGIYQVPPNTFY